MLKNNSIHEVINNKPPIGVIGPKNDIGNPTKSWMFNK